MVKWAHSSVRRARLISACLFLLACLSPLVAWRFKQPHLGSYAFALLLAGAVVYAIVAELDEVHARLDRVEKRHRAPDND